LRRSNDFQRVERQGHRASGALVVVVARRGRARVGFTVSKKVGDAVTRNWVKRRLREAMRAHKELWVGKDVVVIAKPEAAGRSFADLERDVLDAFARLAAKEGGDGKQAKQAK
jgi:ribonuclease P protein component